MFWGCCFFVDFLPIITLKKAVGVKRMNEWINEWMFNNTPAHKLHWLLGVRQWYFYERLNSKYVYIKNMYGYKTVQNKSITVISI